MGKYCRSDNIQIAPNTGQYKKVFTVATYCSKNLGQLSLIQYAHFVLIDLVEITSQSQEKFAAPGHHKSAYSSDKTFILIFTCCQSNVRRV